jgi:hypothetical protein
MQNLNPFRAWVRRQVEQQSLVDTNRMLYSQAGMLARENSRLEFRLTLMMIIVMILLILIVRLTANLMKG